MVAGVPVAATFAAVAGLDLAPDEHFLAGDSDAELAAAVGQLLGAGSSAEALAQAARVQLTNRQPTPEDWANLRSWLDRLARLPRRNQKPSLRSAKALPEQSTQPSIAA
jgi:hypothetical protein